MSNALRFSARRLRSSETWLGVSLVAAGLIGLGAATPGRIDSSAPSDGDSAAPSDGESAAPNDGESAAPSDGESAAPADSGGAARTPASLWPKVAAIFEARCIDCHGPTRRKGGLRLDAPEAIERGGDDGAIIVAGKPDESEL
ncbi:MAG: hypothetical protein FJ253_02695, partial [Phycisphaerae bacterium]|nr:hypothetical protein [Phycisphaerae bacterium]